MKLRRVKRLDLYFPVQLGDTVKSTVDAEVMKCEMELWPVGVLIRVKNKKGDVVERLCFNSVCKFADFYPEACSDKDLVPALKGKV